MKKVLSDGTFLLITCSIALIIGLFFGATKYSNFFTNVKWTDALSSVATVFAFLIAYISYKNWLDNKKKEDSYQIAKNYLSSNSDLLRVIRELNNQYLMLCPSPGVVVEQKENSQARIEHVIRIADNLYQSITELIAAKRELTFWNVSLTKEFELRYDQIISDSNNLSVVLTGLNSQLYHFYNKDSGNTNEVLREKEFFDKYYKSIVSTLSDRLELKFEDMFIFKKSINKKTKEMIKRQFRNVIGIATVFPFIISNRILTLFIGEDRANKLCGPYLTLLAEFVLKFMVPKINKPSEFNLFKNRMKKRFRLWKSLYNFSIAEENDDKIKLNISNCPFCEILIKTGYSELAKYVCQGDWKIAKNNSKNWLFIREHQIGTGDTFCDHTYKRIS